MPSASILYIEIARAPAHTAYKRTVTRLCLHPAHRLCCDDVAATTPGSARRRAAAAAVAGAAQRSGNRSIGAPRPLTSSPAGSACRILPFPYRTRPLVSDNYTHEPNPQLHATATFAKQHAYSGINMHIFQLHNTSLFRENDRD